MKAAGVLFHVLDPSLGFLCLLLLRQLACKLAAVQAIFNEINLVRLLFHHGSVCLERPSLGRPVLNKLVCERHLALLKVAAKENGKHCRYVRQRGHRLECKMEM